MESLSIQLMETRELLISYSSGQIRYGWKGELSGSLDSVDYKK